MSADPDGCEGLHAGANSIFLGDKLLTTPNPGGPHDHALLAKLGVELAERPLLTPT